MPSFPPPRSVYVHVPFCVRRCGYCNFAIVVGRDDLATQYLSAVEWELRGAGSPRTVDTIYLGGGTPTRLPLTQLVRLCELLAHWRPPAPGCEWTVEANPSDVTPELLHALSNTGVTRLSLGGQSFSPTKLRRLERDHSAEQIEQASFACRERGIAVALDLIFAAPGETHRQWRRDLDHAIALAPDHLSTYGLTYEKGAAFWSRRARGDLRELGDELQRRMYLTAIDALTEAGYQHYEVSNFARPGRRSRHNEVYWSGAPYDAFGPGAARYVDGIRETNHRSTTTYLKRVLVGESPVAEREELSPEQRAREQLVFGLRRLEGVNRRAFFQATGYQVDELAEQQIARFAEMGLLHTDPHRIRLTREGLLVSDALWPDLL